MWELRAAGSHRRATFTSARGWSWMLAAPFSGGLSVSLYVSWFLDRLKGPGVHDEGGWHVENRNAQTAPGKQREPDLWWLFLPRPLNGPLFHWCPVNSCPLSASLRRRCSNHLTSRLRDGGTAATSITSLLQQPRQHWKVQQNFGRWSCWLRASAAIMNDKSCTRFYGSRACWSCWCGRRVCVCVCTGRSEASRRQFWLIGKERPPSGLGAPAPPSAHELLLLWWYQCTKTRPNG